MVTVKEEDRDWLRARGLLPPSSLRGWFLELWRSRQTHGRTAIVRGEDAEPQAGPSTLPAQGHTES